MTVVAVVLTQNPPYDSCCRLVATSSTSGPTLATQLSLWQLLQEVLVASTILALVVVVVVDVVDLDICVCTTFPLAVTSRGIRFS